MQRAYHAYDHIELPPIKPVVTRIHRHRGTCPCCRRGIAAPAPAGMAPGSPFGPGLAALILHLHVTQAISFERLVRLMDEVSGTISEGAIANLLALADTKAGLKPARAIRKCRGDLFVFVTRRDVPYTNNGCERALRPSVIFRKVTGCFRSQWGARLYAAAASVIATGSLTRKSALQAIQDALDPSPKPVTA